LAALLAAKERQIAGALEAASAEGFHVDGGSSAAASSTCN